MFRKALEDVGVVNKRLVSSFGSREVGEQWLRLVLGSLPFSPGV